MPTRTMQQHLIRWQHIRWVACTITSNKYYQKTNHGISIIVRYGSKLRRWPNLSDTWFLRTGNRDAVAYLQSGDQRHHILILFNEPQGASQPDSGGMQSNQYSVETNAQTSGTRPSQQDDNKFRRRSRLRIHIPRTLPIAGRGWYHVNNSRMVTVDRRNKKWHMNSYILCTSDNKCKYSFRKI